VPHPGADEIWVRMARGETDGHVNVRTWQSDEELKTAVLQAMVQHVPELEHDPDERGFGISIGGVPADKGVFFNAAWLERNRHGSSERCEIWQVLTPVRGKGLGVSALTPAPVHTRHTPEPAVLAGVVATSTCAAPSSPSRFATAPARGAILSYGSASV
jgi:hypothetical protein